MNALIVEDEIMAARALQRALAENFSDINVVAVTDSVRGTVEWLSDSSHHADIIFMDVELSDGKCFEIFRKLRVSAHVVMTTAYDSYAVKAFEVNSIDYLLKPVEPSALKRAVDRCRRVSPSLDIDALVSALSPHRNFKERFLVYTGDKIVPLKTDDVAYFFSESKGNYAVTKTGARYVMDASLDALVADLDPERFFKISRGCVVAKDVVESVNKLLGGRLAVTVSPALKKAAMGDADLSVSRSRADEFLNWLEK